MTPLTELKKLAELQGKARTHSEVMPFMTACSNIDLPALVAYVESLQNDIGKLVIQRESLRGALRRIEKWYGEFPDTGKFWENTDGTISDRPMSYGACNGSNGERDYMRGIARKVLGESVE